MNRFFEIDNQPREIEDIRKDLLFLNKADLAASLAKTDWQVIRAADLSSGKPVTDGIWQERAQLRQRCEQVEAEIIAAKSFEDLVNIFKNHL